MRGKGKHRGVRLGYWRITPAYAGKSLAEFGKTSKVWDHPRLCGEKSTCPQFLEKRIRITPAYAGKSCLAEQRYGGAKDHPRLCGEKLIRFHLTVL